MARAIAPMASAGKHPGLDSEGNFPASWLLAAVERRMVEKMADASRGCVESGILRPFLRSSKPRTILRQRPENELMLRVQMGDLDAFTQLVERYQNVVYGMALSMLRRPEDAEEAAQDTFLKVFRARATYDASRSLEPWLLRIAGNACRDKLRRRRAATLPMAQADIDLAAELADPSAAHSAAASAAAMDAQLVRQALEQLGDRYRSLFELKYLRGMTNQQIADALSMSLSNVKLQLARGKDVLQSRLASQMEDRLPAGRGAASRTAVARPGNYGAADGGGEQPPRAAAEGEA